MPSKAISAQVRDAGEDEWEGGVVESIDEDGTPRVKRDG